MSDRRDGCPLTHDAYLKQWQLGEPRLAGREWGVFDEAQDASPVMIDVMLRQGFPVTWVGDSHQQIYAWRGAVNAMRMMPGAEFPLTQSFRFGQSVADAANAVLQCKPERLRPAMRVIGNPERASEVGTMPRGVRHTFLSRTNAEWFQEALGFNGPVHVVGGIDETAKLLMSAYELWRNNARPARCAPAIARFANWRELCEHAEMFDDRELLFARTMVEKHYKERLPGAIAQLRRRHVEAEGDAALVLSTAHKAKGSEWPFVRLGQGFSSPLGEAWSRMPEDEQEAEINLLYVALSRAIHGLEPCQAVLDCISYARGARPGDQEPERQRLPEIRLRPPAAAQAAGDIHAAAPAAHARAWTGQEDAEASGMLRQGFCHEDIAAWIGRPAAAVAVRLAVLQGADSSLAAEIRAAFASPQPQPMPAAPDSGGDDRCGPLDFMEHFDALAPAGREETAHPAMRR